MKIPISLFVLGVFLAVGLAGCGSKTEDATSTLPTSKPVDAATQKAAQDKLANDPKGKNDAPLADGTTKPNGG